MKDRFGEAILGAPVKLMGRHDNVARRVALMRKTGKSSRGHHPQIDLQLGVDKTHGCDDIVKTAERTRTDVVHPLSG